MKNSKKTIEPILADLAKNDKKSTVRASALGRLGSYKKAEYTELFKAATRDSSYTVAGSALNALREVDEKTAMTIAKEFSKQKSKGLLKEAITTTIASTGDESMAEELIGGFAKMPMGQEKFQQLNALGTYLAALKNTEKVKQGVDEIVKFRDGIPEQFQNQTNPFINGVILKDLLAKKDEQSKADAGNTALKELVEYIKSKLPAEDKKGF